MGRWPRGGHFDHDFYEGDRRYAVRPDAEIRNEVLDELFWSPFVDVDRVTVTGEDGVAILGPLRVSAHKLLNLNYRATRGVTHPARRSTNRPPEVWLCGYRCSLSNQREEGR